MLHVFTEYGFQSLLRIRLLRFYLAKESSGDLLKHSYYNLMCRDSHSGLSPLFCSSGELKVMPVLLVLGDTGEALGVP